MALATGTRTITVDGDALAAIDRCYDEGWAADGLPVVPPETSRVEAMLAADPRPADKVLATHPATGLSCTLLNAAVNAVMAGCLPQYFPVIVAALTAANRDPFTYHGSAASTGGSAQLLVVAGPVAKAIGLNAGPGVFGPGHRANATIGRAMRLILMNVFDMIPGRSDQSTQGFPGKYAFCIAERSEASPWEPLQVALGYEESESTVVVFAGASHNNIENHYGRSGEAILDCIADSMANLGCISLGESVVVLSPEHAAIVGGSGMSREDVQGYLFEHGSRSRAEMEAVGKFQAREYDYQVKRSGIDDGRVRRGLGPADILVTVAGGLAGGHSAFITSWSRGRASLMQHERIRFDGSID